MEEILEELDECYPPENQKIPKCDFKKFFQILLKRRKFLSRVQRVSKKIWKQYMIRNIKTKLLKIGK